MNIMKNRAASFVIITLIYIAVVAIAFVIYRMMPFSFWLNTLLADIIATVVIFICSLIYQNASVYDPYWSVQPFVILVAFSYGVKMTGFRLLLLFVICFWAIRLTANWAYTFQGLAYQDWRYTLLKENTGRAYFFVNLIGIHMVPTLVVYFCILPAVFAFQYETKINAASILFLLLSIGATVLQGISDIQMHRFRKAKQGVFIRNGAWKYSRHPNYLGEILMWWGVALSVFSVMPERWYLLFGAMANTCLFLFVSIPIADKHQARKEGFTEYRKQTRMLLPLPKMRNK